MHCEELRQLLDKCQGQVSALPASGQRHLSGCDACTDYAEEVEISQMLQQMPVMPASTGFTDRALQQAWEQRQGSDQTDRSSRTGRLAIAACLVLATSVTLSSLWVGREAGESNPVTAQTARVIPDRTSQVNLLMVSAVALPDARITLRMDDNVILAGYGGNREFGWPTSLNAGNNQLTLPIQLQGVDSGNISIQVESDGASKEMMFTVEAMQPQRAAILVI